MAAAVRQPVRDTGPRMPGPTQAGGQEAVIPRTCFLQPFKGLSLVVFYLVCPEDTAQDASRSLRPKDAMSILLLLPPAGGGGSVDPVRPGLELWGPGTRHLLPSHSLPRFRLSICFSRLFAKRKSVCLVCFF